MKVKKVFRAMAFTGAILAAGINLNAQKVTEKAVDTATDETALVLSPEKGTIELGKTLKIAVIKGISEGEKIGVTWKSSEEKVATVDKDGNVTAIAQGKTTITAVAGSKKGTCEVIVEGAKSTILPVDPGKAVATDATSVEVGKTVKIEAKDVVKGVSTLEKSTVTWKSSNEKVAKVDKDGNVTAIAEGVTTITATVGDKKGTVDVTVGKKGIK